MDLGACQRTWGLSGCISKNKSSPPSLIYIFPRHAFIAWVCLLGWTPIPLIRSWVSELILEGVVCISDDGRNAWDPSKLVTMEPRGVEGPVGHSHSPEGQAGVGGPQGWCFGSWDSPGRVSRGPAMSWAQAPK